MTDSDTPTTTNEFPITRRTALKASGAAAGALTIGPVGLAHFSHRAAADDHVIETCGGDVDIVVALDYSGSIANAGTWGDISGGTSSFLGVVPADIQLGLVTFGDAPNAFDLGSGNYLDFASASTLSTLDTYVTGLPVPPNENATHMPGALAFSDAILETEGRAGKEIIILITDGSPNYQNGTVGDGVSPPDDDTSFPYGSFAFTGGTTGGENGTIEQSEKDETAALAASIKTGGRRIITVGVGSGVDDTYLMNSIASSTEDYVQVENAADLGSELEALISDVCEECIDCETDGLLVKYEFDDEDHTFVPEDSTHESITYTGEYTVKDDDWGEPMTVDFETDYCDLYVLVKSGQEFEVQAFENIDGPLTVETANDDRYAISFVAFYCTEQAAIDAMESFPSRGRGR